MKILFINYEFPPLGGGGGRANAFLARELAKLGYLVQVMTSAWRDLARHETIDGYAVWRIPTLRRHVEKCRVHEMMVFMVSSSLQIFRLFKKNNRPDHIIVFFTLPSGLSALLAKFFFGIPYLVSLRGGDVPGLMGRELAFFHGISKPLIKLIWSGAQAVIANSQGLQQLALLTAPDLAVQIIPNGVDTAWFFEPSLLKINSPVKILTVGRLTTQKGFDVLLNSLALLRSRTKINFQCMIIGEGPERVHLETQRSQLGLEHEVNLVGWQEMEAIRLAYQSADIFVLASRYEGMANVVLEAMAAGLPVVSTRVAGAEEQIEVGKNGLLVPIDDEQDLATAIQRLLEDESLRKSFGRYSFQKAQSMSWTEVARQYSKYLRG